MIKELKESDWWDRHIKALIATPGVEKTTERWIKEKLTTKKVSMRR